MIGGKVALRLDPDLLARLAQHLDVVLVSATNGKTTTTRLIAEALRAAGPVVSNALGANMPAGITSALAGGSDAKFGVIEVDEKYLAGVARDVTPKCIALLNLSRDQLDRAAETRMLAEKWREGLSGSKAVIVANADDPLVVWAASSSQQVVWVAAGQAWKDDAWSCPSCGGVMQRPGDDWFCGQCGFRRPTPTWALTGDHVLDPHGSAWPIHLQLPGRANKANATSSAAVAAVFGVPPQVALERMYQVQAVAGRYDVVSFLGRDLRLLLAKNPALLAGDLLAHRPAAHAGRPLRQRTRRRRHRHLVAVGRGLHAAGRTPDLRDRRPQAGHGGAPGGRGTGLPGVRDPGRGGPVGPARPDRDHRELHRVPGRAPPRRQLIRPSP